MEELQRAFAQLSHGDGSLDLQEFRSLWRDVFPGRPMDADTWRNMERMFKEIDTDGSEEITYEEVMVYLERSRREEQILQQRPCTFQQWVWQYCSPNPVTTWKQDDSRLDTYIGVSIILWKMVSQVMVVLSIVILMLESMPHMQGADGGTEGTPATHALETACTVFFTVEFIAWVYSYPPRLDHDSEEDEDVERGDQPPREPKMRKWRPLLLEMNTWVDFLSILPSYLEYIIGDSPSGPTAALPAVRLVRLMRLLRIFRILKMGKGKFGRAPEIGAALKKSLLSLWFLLALIVVTVCLSGTFVFYAETSEQAEFDYDEQKWMRKNDSEYDDRGVPLLFQSIPDSLWWGLVTLTTVGYGDQSPKTGAGKVVGAVTMLSGLIVVGFPVTILTSTFQAIEEERELRENRMLLCREFYLGIKAWTKRLAQQGRDGAARGGGDRMGMSVSVYASPPRAAPSPRDRFGSDAGIPGSASSLGMALGRSAYVSRGSHARGGGEDLARVQAAVAALADSLPKVVRDAESGLASRLEALNSRLAAIDARLTAEEQDLS